MEMAMSLDDISESPLHTLECKCAEDEQNNYNEGGVEQVIDAKRTSSKKRPPKRFDKTRNGV
jgi:hypothetical protein